MKKEIPQTMEERAPILHVLREAKMSTSAHAYVRGSTDRFYEWLLGPDGRRLPSGPDIWISGDCHVGNLGPVARKDGLVETEIRDLDHTVIGCPSHDLIRLSLSLAMAARAWDLGGATTARVVEAIAREYTDALEARADKRQFVLDKPPKALALFRKRALRRTRRELLDERLGTSTRKFPIGRRFWPLTKAEREAVHALFDTTALRKLMTSLAERPDDASLRVLDSAFWVKG